MDILEKYFEDIITEINRHHKVTNRKFVYKAYMYAKRKHEKQKPRKTGEPYIMHPLRVAYLVASWGLDTETISAALLHDTLEDTDATYSDLMDTFNNKNLINMVDAVTAIDIELDSKSELTKEEIDRLSDERLKEKMSEKALFIKVADRIDNLQTIGPFKEEKKILKAKHTRAIIIPMMMKERAYQLIDILENLCLEIEHPQRYTEIVTARSAICTHNNYTISKTLKLFSEVFSQKTYASENTNSIEINVIARFDYNTRSAISIYRQINAQANNISTDLPKLLCKKNIAMYDLSLIISDTYCSSTGNTPADAFFGIYSYLLADKDITIIDLGQTTYKDSIYYLLSDNMGNLYRLFVKSETEYMRYKLGRLFDEETVTDFGAAVDGKKIKVYRRDESAMYIEDGATFLDFAFAIHSEVGLHFHYAIVDDNKFKHQAYESINEGDVITIETNPNVLPELRWFKYVKTNRAIDQLIKYFSTNKDSNSKLSENQKE